MDSIEHTANTYLDTLSIRKGTPDHVSSTVPLEYQTDNLSIRLCDDDEYGPQAWDAYFPVMRYNVYAKDDGHHVGDLYIDYDYEAKTMQIDTVGIVEQADRGKGYGVQMYTAVPHIALPDGRMPDEAGFTFITEEHSPEAERVWRALAKRGLVTNVGDDAYIWNSYDRS